LAATQQLEKPTIFQPSPKADEELFALDYARIGNLIIEELPGRCTKTQLVISLRALSGVRAFPKTKKWCRLDRQKIADKLGVSFQHVYQEMAEMTVRAGEVIPEGNLMLLEVRGYGRNEEFRPIEANMLTAPLKSPKKFKPKPPTEEAAPLPADGYAEVNNPMPLAAFHAAAPDAVMVVFPGGRAPIPLNRNCPTCQNLRSFALENQRDTRVFQLELKGESENRATSGANLAGRAEHVQHHASSSPDIVRETLAGINEEFEPIFGYILPATDVLWKQTLAELGDTPLQYLLWAVARKAKKVRETGIKPRGYGILLALAKEAKAAYEHERERGIKPKADLQPEEPLERWPGEGSFFADREHWAELTDFEREVHRRSFAGRTADLDAALPPSLRPQVQGDES
jgi:hypothetical protein